MDRSLKPGEETSFVASVLPRLKGLGVIAFRPCSGVKLEADCNFGNFQALVAADLLKSGLVTANPLQLAFFAHGRKEPISAKLSIVAHLL